MEKEIEGEGNDVFLNGRFVGHVNDTNKFVTDLRDSRRKENNEQIL